MAIRYGQDRQQAMLLPPSIDEYISEDNPVRVYDEFVESLDFEALGIDLDEQRIGCSRYDPRAMLKLLLYGYSYGITSSRKLERETHQNLGFIWLMSNLTPDHKTIAQFRRNNKSALKKALAQCARLCLKLNLVEGNVLFVDSTKIWANAGKGSQHSKKWYADQLKQVERRIEQILTECEVVDQDEKNFGSLVKMPKELVSQNRLKETIKQALAEFEERGERTKNGKKRQINRVDPKSTQMKSPQGNHPGFSIQSVVDEKNGLIVSVDAVSDANDLNQMSNQILKAEDNTGKKCKVACADAGYSNIDDLAKIESDKRSVIVPTSNQASKKNTKPFSKKDFTYDMELNCYYCPEGRRLSFLRFSGKKLDYRIEDKAICLACRHFGICTSSKNGRTIVRHSREEIKERIEKRYEQPKAKAIYGLRKARVEHPFGYMKKVLGFRQFNLRGLWGARAEASILALSFNITRMINLSGGVQALRAKMVAV